MGPYCNVVLHGAPTGTIQKPQRISSGCPPGYEMIVTASAALAAGPAADYRYTS